MAFAIENICMQISIPYGAIKSKFDLFMQIISIIFQFLMVRLKVNLHLLLNNHYVYFNSLWCD